MRRQRPSPATDQSEASEVSPHPESCPWCGQQQIRGIVAASRHTPQYRCAACGTTFFIHTPDARGAAISVSA